MPEVNMPKEIAIPLIIVGSIFGVWLLLFIVNMIFLGSYLAIFRKHKKALIVILYDKLDNIKKMMMTMKQSGIDVDNRLIAIANDISENDFLEPGSKQYNKSRDLLSYLKDELMFISNKHPELNDIPEFVQSRNYIIESDNFYRNSVLMYNADVLGYNYWVRFLPCRFIFLMFHAKKKETIS